MPEPGEVEYEFGVPIPGVIKPAEQWARTAYKHFPPPGPLDWRAIFGREAPVILELGCGNGRFTLLSALQRPECDHFSSDILPAVIRYATRRGNRRGLHNVRFAVKDAQTLMRAYVAPGSVAEVHLYHPQPFHDQRAASRRLVTPEFLADVHRALRLGGLFVVQTDCPEYWAYIVRAAPGFFRFEEQREPWPNAPDGRSRREILARSRGLPIFRGYGPKRDELTAEQLAELVRNLPLPTFRTRGPNRELDALENEGFAEHRGPRRKFRGPWRARRG